MSEVWIALGICVVIVVSGAMPLIRDRRRPKGPLPPRPDIPPRPETLRDWRKEGRGE